MQWINLAQIRDKWRSPAGTVKKLRFAQTLFTGCGNLFFDEGLVVWSSSSSS
jgi:hypothetical protein